jgi:hypothetical protein
MFADGEVVWSDAPTLASSFRGASFSEAMVANKPGHQGELEVSRKTIAQGMPVETGEPVATTSCIFCTNHGCIGHPAFPAPSSLSGE